jgi:hypothetical protein
MRQIDMSAEAVTSRLKLVSELLRLCLKLGTAKIESRFDHRRADEEKKEEIDRTRQHSRE